MRMTSLFFLKYELSKLLGAEKNETFSVYMDRMRPMFREEEF